MLRPLALALFAVSFAVCPDAEAQYAEAPFRSEAIPSARALVESVGINNWLRENYSRMDQFQMQGAREHLHALIDARVKDSYAKSGALTNPQPDGLMAMLYSWAGRLGVFGADLVYSAVKGDYPIQPPPGPTPPEDIVLKLSGDSLLLSSSTFKWTAKIPYHFFVFGLNDGRALDGKRTQSLVVSTSTAADAAPPGYSQATIAMIFVEDADKSSFEREWSQRFQIPMDTENKQVGSSRYRSRSAYDPKTRLHRELVYVPSEKGAFVIFYSGLNGTYQANRPHFMDFMSLISLPN